jgi:hypothetical protein
VRSSLEVARKSPSGEKATQVIDVLFVLVLIGADEGCRVSHPIINRQPIAAHPQYNWQ